MVITNKFNFGIYRKIWPAPSASPSGCALGNSLGLAIFYRISLVSSSYGYSICLCLSYPFIYTISDQLTTFNMQYTNCLILSFFYYTLRDSSLNWHVYKFETMHLYNILQIDCLIIKIFTRP